MRQKEETPSSTIAAFPSSFQPGNCTLMFDFESLRRLVLQTVEALYCVTPDPASACVRLDSFPCMYFQLDVKQGFAGLIDFA